MLHSTIWYLRIQYIGMTGIWVAAKLRLPSLAGVLAGAIDYYILDKFQRLTNTKTYTKVHIASANLLYASPCI
jgi:hypothetical protein